MKQKTIIAHDTPTPFWGEILYCKCQVFCNISDSHPRQRVGRVYVCGNGCEKRWRKHWVQIKCSASVEELYGCSVDGSECGVVLVFTLIRLQWYLGATTCSVMAKGWIDTGKCCGGALRTVGANVVRRGWLSVISDCCRYRERRMARGGSALVNWRTSPAHSWRKQYVPFVNRTENSHTLNKPVIL